MGNKAMTKAHREAAGIPEEADAGGDEPAGDAAAALTIDPSFGTSSGKPLTIDEFDLIKVLGKGSFGKVMLVKRKGGDGTLLAMKTLRKAALIKRNQIAHTATERNILQNISHPFLMRLVYAFQTADKLYMVLEYMGGGELFHWLKAHKRFSEPRSKLYCAEMGLAMAELHKNNIVYRDLKPENLLLDLEGHIRITDFGLAKDGVTGAGAAGGTTTFCGTPEYLAPEILENKGHGKAVDWWSMGTLLFEMMAGLPPFYDTNFQRMYKKILSSPLRFPAHLSADAQDVLKKLLTRPVASRLGSGPADFEDIAATPFFKSLDMAKVLAKGYPIEFTPPVKGADSGGNFDAEFTSERPQDSHVVSTLSGAQKEAANFDGFTFKGPTGLDG